MIIYYLFIPLSLLFVPWLMVRYLFKTDKTVNLPYKEHAVYLWVAALTWWAAVFVPNLQVSDQTDSSSMHFLGGVVAAILFVYAVKVYKIKFSEWWQSWATLYLFVSGLGVLNELFEFFLDSFIMELPMSRTDTWWDLAANTIGAFTAYFLIEIFRKKYTKV